MKLPSMILFKIFTMSNKLSVALNIRYNMKWRNVAFYNWQPTKINIMINFMTHSIQNDVFHVVLRYFWRKYYLSVCCCHCQHSNWYWMLVNLLSVPLTLSGTFFHFQNELLTCWPSQNWISFTHFLTRLGKPIFKNRSVSSITDVFSFDI